MSQLEDLVNSAVAGWQDANDDQRSVVGWAAIHVLDERAGAARLIFESAVERRAARLPRWLAIFRFERPAGRRVRIIWLLDGRTVRWSRGLPPWGLRRAANHALRRARSRARHSGQRRLARVAGHLADYGALLGYVRY